MAVSKHQHFSVLLLAFFARWSDSFVIRPQITHLRHPGVRVSPSPMLNPIAPEAPKSEAILLV
jgi:hypothetical protein